MKTIITIRESDALAAGINNQGEYLIEFDPADLTQEQREELLHSEQSSFNNKYEWMANKGDSPGPYYDVSNIVKPVRPDLETLKALLDARIIRRVEVLAKIEKEKQTKTDNDLKNIEKWMSNPEKCVSYDYRDVSVKMKRIYLNWDAKNYYNTVPGFEDAIEDAKSLIFWQNLELDIAKTIKDKEKDRKEAEEDAVDAATATRKTNQISGWVFEHGTQSQKDRLEENLLPETEIIDGIRSKTYAPLDEWPRHDKLKTSDICSCEYEHCEVDFDVDEKESATEEEFEQLQKIKELMPGATVELREHTGESEDCKNTVRSTGFMVRMTVGEFEFSREYGLKTDTETNND